MPKLLPGLVFELRLPLLRLHLHSSPVLLYMRHRSWAPRSRRTEHEAGAVDPEAGRRTPPPETGLGRNRKNPNRAGGTPVYPYSNCVGAMRTPTGTLKPSDNAH